MFLGFVLQAEMELRICQSLFDRQSEITRRAAEGITDTQVCVSMYAHHSVTHAV